MKKTTAQATLKTLPNEFNLEQLIEKLILIEKIEKGIEQADSGKTLSHEAVAAKIKSWQI